MVADGVVRVNGSRVEAAWRVRFIARPSLYSSLARREFPNGFRLVAQHIAKDLLSVFTELRRGAAERSPHWRGSAFRCIRPGPQHPTCA